MTTIDELTEAGVRCRTYGHAWEEAPAASFDVELPRLDMGWYLTLYCSRCETERIDTITDLGTLLRRRYRYRDSYQRSRGSDRLTRDQLRLELNRRRRLSRRRNRRVS